MISSLNDLKVGLSIIVDNEPYLIVEHDFMRTAQRKPVMRTKLKNLITGKVLEKTFKPGDKVDEADLAKKKANHLYKQGTDYFFMNNEDYEQFFLSEAQLGEKGKFLKEGMDVDVLYFNNQPVNISFPQKIALKVAEAPEGVKGDSAGGNITKEITLENGLKVRAPMFIKEGELVMINTETGEYVNRASEEDQKKAASNNVK